MTEYEPHNSRVLSLTPVTLGSLPKKKTQFISENISWIFFFFLVTLLFSMQAKSLQPRQSVYKHRREVERSTVSSVDLVISHL